MMRFPASAILLFLLPGMAAAQSASPLELGLLAPTPPPPGIGQSANLPAPATVPVADDRVAFNSTEQWLIPLYFQKIREKQKRAARSKRNSRSLPAGLTQDPAKGDLLPAPILAELHPLPGPLIRDLPPARPGTDRVIAGKNVLMVNTATGEVLDILGNIP